MPKGYPKSGKRKNWVPTGRKTCEFYLCDNTFLPTVPRQRFCRPKCGTLNRYQLESSASRLDRRPVPLNLNIVLSGPPAVSVMSLQDLTPEKMVKSMDMAKKGKIIYVGGAR